MNEHLLNIFSESGCPPYETLVDYFRNRLPEEEKHLVEKHLVDCEMCSDALEGLSLMKRPEELDRIVEEIAVGVYRKRSRVVRWERRVLALAAAAVIVFLAGSALVIRLVLPGDEETRKTVTFESPAPATFAEKATEPPPPPAMQGSPQMQPRESNGIHGPETKARTTGEQKPPGTELYTVSSRGPSLADTVIVAGMEPRAVAGVVSSRPVDSEAPSEIREVPSPINEVTVMPALEKQGAPKEDASKKSQVLLFASSPARTDTLAAALLFFNSGDYRTALQWFGRILRDQPANFKALYYSALCYYKQGDPAGADRFLQQILRSPGNEFYVKAQELSIKTASLRDSVFRARTDTMK
jgi:hypothetical protein